MCLLGVSFILLPILGVKSPKTPILGALISIFKLNLQNIKICILSKLLCTDYHQILHSHKDHQVLFVGGPNTRKTYPRWRTAAILKNWKIAISQPRFERFRQNLACRRSCTLLSVPTVKILKFPKSKMAAAAILKNRKSAISPERFDQSSRNLSLIHIWRCRRSTLCRSRWSPYH